MFCISDLSVRWRDEADSLRHRGHDDLARMVESFAEDLEAEIESEGAELLTIAEAAAFGGYSEEQLRRNARNGKLPATRSGEGGNYRVKRQDVPKKSGPKTDAPRARDGYNVHEDACDIAERLRRQ